VVDTERTPGWPQADAKQESGDQENDLIRQVLRDGNDQPEQWQPQQGADGAGRFWRKAVPKPNAIRCAGCANRVGSGREVVIAGMFEGGAGRAADHHETARR
jgi:hypothetical protein